MDVIKRQAYCHQCGDYVLAEHETSMSDGMGCLLSLFTCGLFLPVFLFMRFVNYFSGYRCPYCGTKT